MRNWLFVILFLFCTISLRAEDPDQFNPKRFEVEMEQFITVEAGLTPVEAAKFFPLFREMQGKQRLLFEEMNQYRHIDTSNNKASLNAIKKMDDIDIQIKKLQQQYHLKFCKIMPAGKVLKVLQADEKFHRQAFRRMVRRNQK